MPRYIARPVTVDAFVILEVIEGANGHKLLLLDDQTNPTFDATPEMLARFTEGNGIQAGDYLVIQSDGYVYLNPKAVFERKYEAAPKPVEYCGNCPFAKHVHWEENGKLVSQGCDGFVPRPPS